MESSMVYNALLGGANKAGDEWSFRVEPAATLTGGGDGGGSGSILSNVTGSSSALTAADNLDSGSVSMDNFYPALVQCFGIIICGYVAGRFKIITNAETKGLGTFVGTFALPSLIFLSLVELDWKTVNWVFLSAMLISKAIVFFVVLIISLLVARPLNYARAGLLASFCTQSNDFAIGYPIVLALYKDVHPAYASYLYLMAPISLAILNPIGMIFLEIAKIQQEKIEAADSTSPPHCRQSCPADIQRITSQRRCLGERSMLVWNMIKSLFFNPLLLMTVLGVIGGCLFPKGLPEVIASVLRVFGNSFSATALFLLGLKIVGSNNASPTAAAAGSSTSSSSTTLLLPVVLILAKVLALPLVSRQTVNIMQAGVDFNDTTELSTFGFLYGTFPPAPGTFVIATQYNVDVELIARSMVLCTFISAPIMFISAKMISLTNLKPLDYLHELDVFSLDISIAGVAACVWLIVLFVFTKRYRRMPQRITFALVLSQLMSCISIILWSKLEQSSEWLLYLQFVLFNIGTYSSRLWTCFLAIALVCLQCRSLCYALKLWPYMFTIAWGVPAVISALLLAFDADIMSDEKHSPSFQYGNAQAAVSVFLIVMSFMVTVGCLVLHQRYKKRHELNATYAGDLSIPETDSTDLQSTISTANLLNNVDRAPPRRRHVSSSTCSSDDDDMLPIGAQRSGRGDGGSDANTMKVVINNRTEGNSNCCSSSTATTPTSARTTVVDIEDLLHHQPETRTTAKLETLVYEVLDRSSGRQRHMCANTFCMPSGSRRQCRENIRRYEEATHRDLDPLELANDIDEQQTLQHTTLLVALLCSMFVSLSLSIWTLVMEGMSGIYLELSFLDAFLNFGQSLIVLAVFFVDTGELFTPVVSCWRKIWYGANVLSLPPWPQLPVETKHICEQFRKHHLEKCRMQLSKERRWRFRIYSLVFFGTEFVDWLIEVGLAKDRREAVHYARHLLDGRVLRHINNVHHFEDKNLVYTFCTRCAA